MTRDPMLDGITRYDSDDYDVELPEKPDGIYVAFSDLPALIARVREDERKASKEAHFPRTMLEDFAREGYARGQRDERARIRAGVTGLFWSPSNMLTTAEVLAVIDGGES